MVNSYVKIDVAMRMALENVMDHGSTVMTRGRKVRELIGESVSFDMRYPIVTNESRKIGHRFYAAEAAWIIAGRNDLRFFKNLNMSFIWEFSDDGVYYQGAYGPQVVEQLTYVCDALVNDRNTRQAVISVWRPNPRPSRDIPCTLTYQFIRRNATLHCIQSMRSSDVWLGYPYDAFNAAMLAAYIILLLRERGMPETKLGSHTLMVGSQHIYEEQWEQAIECINDTSSFEYDAFDPLKYSSPDDLLEWLYLRAQSTTGVDPRFNSM